MTQIQILLVFILLSAILISIALLIGLQLRAERRVKELFDFQLSLYDKIVTLWFSGKTVEDLMRELDEAFDKHFEGRREND